MFVELSWHCLLKLRIRCVLSSLAVWAGITVGPILQLSWNRRPWRYIGILNSFNFDLFDSLRSIFRRSTKPKMITFSKELMRKNSLRSSEFQRESLMPGSTMASVGLFVCCFSFLKRKTPVKPQFEWFQ